MQSVAMKKCPTQPRRSSAGAMTSSALAHLLENAALYSPPSTTIEISGEVTGEGLRLAIRDHGPGFDEADLPHVFDRFYRAESARGATAGAGLGLAIAKWIADVHGAEITIAPAPERGTRVTVRFPGAAMAQA